MVVLCVVAAVMRVGRRGRLGGGMGLGGKVIVNIAVAMEDHRRYVIIASLRTQL